VAPRITTIVPTYRRPVLLKRAVLSVLNQAQPDFVVKIFDNASGDETEAVARALAREDARVEYHRHDTNVGHLQNLIFGMSRVTTPYFNVLCDDDVLMPEFFATSLQIHERAPTPLAFAATHVVVVDESGRFRDPWPYPRQPCRLLPPHGVTRCVKDGVSIPGVLYRTDAVEAIGAPRLAWWNWTESGWHALAAARFPIEFSPVIGAVVFNHEDSGSKRMSSIEFRISWFQMLSEVHAAVRDPSGDTWWTDEMLPAAYARFFGCLVRLCRREGLDRYDTLAQFGVASGLNARGVFTSVRVARAAAVLGIGEPLNAVLDWMMAMRGRFSRSSGASAGDRPEAAIHAASRVFADLNRQVGVV
jgi:glycosyltransferase involved in cell wall biosynthesis